MTADEINALGYSGARQLPTGEWVAVQSMLYTTGLFIVVDGLSWKTRWCYERAEDANVALTTWDGKGDPPGPWIKQKPEDRLNPDWSRS